MAPNLAKANTQFFSSIFLVVSTIVTCLASNQFQETNMVIYTQGKFTSPGLTDIPVAGIAGSPWFFTTFGTIYVTDDNITTTIDRNSDMIGHAHGIYVASTLDGSSVYVAMSVWFTSGVYEGSTIELQGTSILEMEFREVAVVSGTGKFRFARGYATWQTAFVDQVNGYGTDRLNITVFHH
ncbi:Dirigent protein [Dillenia turbinata]|uniref:Dirigent protein n=1 Tax=Dillenia turbinata TaxID=194707 RepID=A0AAN8UPN0_9MAGN